MSERFDWGGRGRRIYYSCGVRSLEAARRRCQRFGLASTAVRDGETHRPALTRADLGRAARHGDKVPDRTWLRHQVRATAAAAGSEADWVADLRARGVLIHLRTDAADPTKVTGYAVARDHAGRAPVYYAGSKLDGQLSLPRLRRRWPGTELPAPEWGYTPPPTRPPARGNATTWRAAAKRLDAVAAKATTIGGDPADAQLLTARAQLTPLLTAAADRGLTTTAARPTVARSPPGRD